jgi:ribulose-bisphosphate carboxylase large chain
LSTRHPERFTISYRITVRDGRSIERHATDIAIEQTVEVPEDCIPPSHYDRGLVGRIEHIEPLDGGTDVYDVTISYRIDVTGFALPQFLNTLFGNISLKNNIRITDLQLPDSLAGKFRGPNEGIDGLRAITGIYGRPLTATALKPMGLSVKELADLAGSFAEGGVEIIKDDHGIDNQPFHPFTERIPRCQEAVERAFARTGRQSLYMPMVSGGFDAIEEQVRFAVRHGVRGVMIAPMLVGLDTMRYIADTYKIVILGHPAFTGALMHDPSHGLTPAVLLGTLFRMAGADATIFANAGGRFPITPDECRDLAVALRTEHPVWKRCWPVPAGGMHLGRIDEMAEVYGEDTILLIGGDLLRHKDGVTVATRQFVEALRGRFGERRESPREQTASSCEYRPPSGQSAAADTLLRFDNFRWNGQAPQPYKSSDELPFAGIARHELVGKESAGTSFDLRYFEIQPGGYSSLECHAHEHVIIGARGTGRLIKADTEVELTANDIAVVAPMEKHQLQNRSDSPFGFYCIVDRVRDRPRPVEDTRTKGGEL